MTEQEKLEELERRIKLLENRQKLKPDNEPWKALRWVIWGIVIVFLLLTGIGITQFVKAG